MKILTKKEMVEAEIRQIEKQITLAQQAIANTNRAIQGLDKTLIILREQLLDIDEAS